MDKDYTDYSEMAYDARRDLERERDRLVEQVEQMEDYLRVLDNIDVVLDENKRLKEQNEELRQQYEEEKQRRAKVEMNLMEMSKLSADVAKKASDDNLMKGLKTYVNRSKRKTADKRAFAKSATLEIANANGLDLPEDLKAAIESLDDEQTEPKITVQGDYVVEKKVDQEIGNIEEGGIGVKVDKEA